MSRALSKRKREDFIALFDSLSKTSVEMKKPTAAVQHGETFYTWLKKGLANNEIKVNTADAGVHIVKEGVFLEKKIFKQFVEIYNAPVNMNIVFTQFGNLLGIAKKDGTDYVNDQYFSEYPQARDEAKSGFASPIDNRQKSLRTGMLLADPSMVFVNAQIPAVSPMLKAMQPKSAQDLKLPLIITNQPQNTIK